MCAGGMECTHYSKLSVFTRLLSVNDHFCLYERCLYLLNHSFGTKKIHYYDSELLVHSLGTIYSMLH